MKAEEFNQTLALNAAIVLQRVLKARKHRRVHLGEEIWVPGKLGEALALPKIIRQLQSKVTKQREIGLTTFQALWPTLSENTRAQVQKEIGWYEPNSLSWEDKRSNRRARLDDD